MEIAKLISALEETVDLLQASQFSNWSSMSIDEIIQSLETEIARTRESQPIHSNHLKMLFSPTGPIQEISIDNGWGNDFLRISNIVDDLLGGT